MSSAEERLAALERRIGEALDAQRFDHAAQITIEGYGPEILGFLVAVQRNEVDARDVFSQFSEDLWRGMATFRRASSMRTWAYKLARSALARFARDPFRRRGRRLETEEYSQLVARVSSQISVERATGKLAAAREALTADDQALLVLRIDRKMHWNEIAEVMTESDLGVSPGPDAAALRKRFERIKERLRKVVAAG
ncbi:MAG TPA: sigma-70 family RNA polymerase sigma factor [Kofleriaceae bacterium]|nr:sigma-70 family RNA polymerase sigma factor [Kofleriaceae bacterium]